MTEEQSVQEHLSHFQKILTNLLNIGEKVEEKIRMLVLLASLPPYESLVTALLVGKSDIQMDEVVIHVIDETSLTIPWSKLEKLYMMKSLTNTLFLRRQFYQLQMIEE